MCSGLACDNWQVSAASGCFAALWPGGKVGSTLAPPTPTRLIRVDQHEGSA